MLIQPDKNSDLKNISLYFFCLEKKDFCEKVCGDDPDVICTGDTTKKETTKCACINKDEMYDESTKTCKSKILYK